MTERESAHPGSLEIPAELVSAENDIKNAKKPDTVKKPVETVEPVRVR